METESRMVVAGGWREQSGGLVFKGCRVSAGENDKVLEMDESGTCSTLKGLNATELYT